MKNSAANAWYADRCFTPAGLTGKLAAGAVRTPYASAGSGRASGGQLDGCTPHAAENDRKIGVNKGNKSMVARPLYTDRLPARAPAPETSLPAAVDHLTRLIDRMAQTAARGFMPLATETVQSLAYDRLLTALIVRLADLLDCDVMLARRDPQPRRAWYEDAS